MMILEAIRSKLKRPLIYGHFRQNLLLLSLIQPTPLWATILLALLCCVYIYLKIRRLNQSLKDAPKVEGKLNLEHNQPVSKRMSLREALAGFKIKEKR